MRFSILLFVFILSVLRVAPSPALEYPFNAGMQILIDATTTVVNQYPTRWRYELWIFGEREPGKFNAVWANYTNIGSPQEMIVGAIPLVIGRDGSKQFGMEREATYQLQDQIESYIPDLSPISSFEGTWKCEPTATGWYNSFQVLGKQDGYVHCRFAQYGVDNADQIVGTQTVGDIFFDPNTNLPMEIRATTTQQSGQGQMQVSQVARLSKRIERDQAWIENRKEESRDFFNVLNAHDDALLAANDDLSSATLDLSSVFNLWNDWLQKNTTSRFYRLGQTQYKVLGDSVPFLQQFWERRRSVIGRRAPNFNLSDTAGNAYNLQSLPAQPILLLFWSRNSWWSLIALRETVALQQKYGPRGLLVLPINVDPADEEAKGALATMGLNIATLRSPNPAFPESYGIPQGLIPSTVLINPDRAIADLRYGWGKQTVAEILKSVERAL